MSHASERPDPALRRYLLGQLGEEDMERVDRQILAEAEAMAALESAEDELIEDYLDGSLDGAERAAFEEHFLASPSHRQSLELARLIRDRLQGPTARVAAPPRRMVGPWLGALAALLLIAVWFLLPAREERPRVVDHGGTIPPAPAVPSSIGTPSPSGPPRTPSPARVAAVSLAVNRTMAPAESPSHVVKLDSGVEQVRLDVVLEGHEAYRDLSARLEGPGGAPVHEWKRVAPQPIVPLALPARGLAPGPYTLVLVGRDRESGGPAELDRWDLVVQKR